MGYIFTEYFFDTFKSYISFNMLISQIMIVIGNVVVLITPYFVKHLIGYCNFYNQLGYGAIFYVYFFRRHKAKKTNNWNSFYGDSVSNWVLFNIALFNKFIFNINFIMYSKTIILKSYLILIFWITNYSNENKFINKIKKNYTLCITNNIKHIWTPVFKRTSYISFFTLLKRFSKRK